MGGVVGLALVSGLVFFFWRRRHRETAPHIEPLVVSSRFQGGAQMFGRQDSDPEINHFNPELLMRSNTTMPGYQDVPSFIPGSSDALLHADNSAPARSQPQDPSVRPLPALPMPLSSKALMHLRRMNENPNSTGTSSAYYEQSMPRTVTALTPASSSGRTGASNSTTRTTDLSLEDQAAQQLRAEVASLRREMQEIREAGFEAPPTYVS